MFLQPGASVDSAVAQITAVAQTVLRQMPPGMQPPLIIQYNASTVPILQYSFSSSKMSEQELFDVTANQVRVGLVQRARRDDSVALWRQDARHLGGFEPARAQGQEPCARRTWSTPSMPKI